MPMIDAFIPSGVFDARTEKQLAREVTDLLVGHELRRILDLVDDPGEVQASHERARSIAWLFIHRAETFVAGEIPEMPHYKFHISVPEGQADDVFRESVVPDITRAVATAEDGRWRHVAARVWVLIHEVPDGHWGAGGRANHVEDIVDTVAPGLGELAARRLADRRRDAAGSR